MKQLALIVALALVNTPALAQSTAQTAQQEKMKVCSAEAGKKELKGDERRRFLSECLKAKPASEEKKLTPQQEKMRTCNAEASKKKLKGDERKKYMGECLQAK